MRVGPILMQAEMVRATLDGRKGQTRRVMKPQPVGGAAYHGIDPDGKHLFVKGHTYGKLACPYGGPGDLLYVKCAYDLFPVYFRGISFGAGKYAVGTDGRVYNVSGVEPRICASHENHNGYQEITLRHDGEQHAFRVNRLVAEAFYGPPPSADAVTRHMDDNRGNNLPENLDWGTLAQNTADANAAGRWSGEKNGGSSLTDGTIAEIRASSKPQAILAERFGVTQPTISKIKSGKRWRAKHPMAPPRNAPAWSPWRSPIYCPRWASRLTLRLTDVRVERVRDISEEDAIAEGCISTAQMIYEGMGGPVDYKGKFAYDHFAELWNSINAKRDYSWAASPWVWILVFDVIKKNVDEYLKEAA